MVSSSEFSAWRLKFRRDERKRTPDHFYHAQTASAVSRIFDWLCGRAQYPGRDDFLIDFDGSGEVATRTGGTHPQRKVPKTEAEKKSWVEYSKSCWSGFMKAMQVNMERKKK